MQIAECGKVPTGKMRNKGAEQQLQSNGYGWVRVSVVVRVGGHTKNCVQCTQCEPPPPCPVSAKEQDHCVVCAPELEATGSKDVPECGSHS